MKDKIYNINYQKKPVKLNLYKNDINNLAEKLNEVDKFKEEIDIKNITIYDLNSQIENNKKENNNLTIVYK